jgi:hypothetical protein
MRPLASVWHDLSGPEAPSVARLPLQSRRLLSTYVLYKRDYAFNHINGMHVLHRQDLFTKIAVCLLYTYYTGGITAATVTV